MLSIMADSGKLLKMDDDGRQGDLLCGCRPGEQKEETYRLLRHVEGGSTSVSKVK